MLAVVLAAGRGKRLRPLTDARPKALLPIAGRPMVERVLAMLWMEGVTQFVVVAQPSDKALAALLDLPDRPWSGQVRLAYQAEPLGMAHALGCAAAAVEAVGVDAFLLAACDNLFPPGHVRALAAQREGEGLDACLTLLRVPPSAASSLAVVTMLGERVEAIVEKPADGTAPPGNPAEPHDTLGSVALYALHTSILRFLDDVPRSPRGEYELQDALRLLIDAGGEVGGLLVRQRQTLTHPADLVALNRHFLHAEPGCAVIAPALPPDLTIQTPVRIEPDVAVGPGSRVGPDVYLEAGCRIGHGVTLQNAVVLRGAVVAPGTRIVGQAVG